MSGVKVGNVGGRGVMQAQSAYPARGRLKSKIVSTEQNVSTGITGPQIMGKLPSTVILHLPDRTVERDAPDRRIAELAIGDQLFRTSSPSINSIGEPPIEGVTRAAGGAETRGWVRANTLCSPAA